MTKEQEALLVQAKESLDATKYLKTGGYPGFAASSAYYTMFYAAQAMLLDKDLTFSKHSGVRSAFGQQFAKTNVVPVEFHRFLAEGMEVRHAADYSAKHPISAEEADTQIQRAEKFLQLAGNFLAKGK